MINGYDSLQNSQCENLINSFGNALKSCLASTFDKIFSDHFFR